jgi:hypothetical protein
MGEIRLTRLRGRNDYDPPLAIPEDQAHEMINVDLYDGQLGRKRGGTSADTMTFSAGGPFTTPIVTLIRHVPAGGETAMELFAIEQGPSPVVGRKAASTQYAAVTVKDPISTGEVFRVMGVSFNNKLFFGGWNSTVNRAQVWDGSTIRRVGVGTPAAATVANTGSGSYPTTIRYYRVAYTVRSGSVTVRRSELSPSVSFTPSGSGTHARVTKPASISEGETHWELYASPDNVSFYGPVATTAVGTTTFDDNTTVSNYALNFTIAPVAGTNLPPPSARFIATDGNRLLFYGALESSAGDSVEPKQGRVWFTPPLGAGVDSIGDDERIPIQSTAPLLRYYIDVGEHTGGEPRGLAGPLDGSMYAFQSNGITELAPTGRANTPYRRFQLNTPHGSVNQRSIVHAPDASGNPCIYFLSPKDGPRRIGRNGIEWVGADVKALWDRVNLDVDFTAHGQYHAGKNQIWWWISVETSSPNVVIVFDISEGVASVADGSPAIRKGWTQFDGDLSTAYCSVMFSETPGATMASRLKPYVGTTTNNQVLKCDTGTATCRAYIVSRVYPIAGLTSHGAVTGAVLSADPADGVNVELKIAKDFATEFYAGSVSLSPDADGTFGVIRTVSADEIGLSGATTVHVIIGDAESVASAWTLNELVLTTDAQEPRT